MKNRIFFFSIALIYLSSCQDPIEVNIRSFEELLVVEGGITHRLNQKGAQQIIKLSTTKDYFDQNSEVAVDNAQVGIDDGTNYYEFTHTGGGAYTADIQTEIGTSYTLKIEYNGQQYEATETLVDVPRIDSIYAEYEEESIFSDEGYFVRINTVDPAGQANYYHWKVFKNGVFFIVPDPGNQFDLIASDQFFDGQVLIGLEPNEEVLLEVGDQVRVEQHGISERYHNYLEQFFEQSGGGQGFGNPPPGRLKGNVINLTDSNTFALGYFSVASVAEAEMIVESP